MATRILPEDAELGLMQDRQVAVLGFGAEGAAHALNLRDSGVDVRVGLPEDSRARARAETEGLTVVTPGQACAEADFVVLLEPDHRQDEVYAAAVADHLQEGDALLFAQGRTVRFGATTPPAGVDVLLVAPQAEGRVVRREYVDGRGVGCLVAVQQDASGMAWPLATAYAAAIGGLRSGGMPTTFAEEAEARAFGRLAVHDSVAALVEAGYDTLVHAGYDPEIAYLACLHELKDVVDRMYADGLPARDGGDPVVDAGVRARMAGVLERVRAGRLEVPDAGGSNGRGAGVPGPTRRRATAQGHPIGQTGREVRSLMSWIRT